MKPMVADVWQFHKHFGHPIGDRPHWLPPEREKFRLKLNAEEDKELAEALACPRDSLDGMVNVVDAIVDGIYFRIGMMIEMGIPISYVWDAVHRANMRKANREQHEPKCHMLLVHQAVPGRKCNCGAVSYTPEGKTAKPLGWVGPEKDIQMELELSIKQALAED